MDISELRELLRTETATIVFTKVNGEKREMHCTLNSMFLPVLELNPNIKYAPSQFTITVWDLEQNQWRSIKFESIESIETDSYVG